MTTFRLPALAVLTAALLAACTNETQNATPAASEASTPKRLAITAIVEHPSLDDIRRGVIDQLKEEGFEEGKNLLIDFQSAQGNTATAAQIAKKFAGDNPDAIVAIATPSAQAVAAATQTVPVVFAGITDPIGAKLVDSWEPSGSNITGTSNQHDIAYDIELMQAVVPDLKRIGYVYSPGEANSVVVLNQLREAAGKIGIEVIDVPAQQTSAVLTAARSLNGKADIIYTSNDNNVVAAYPSMYKAAVEMQIPLVAADSRSVESGAVAAVGVDDYLVGKDSGKMVAQIFRGEKAGNIAPTQATEFDIYLNAKHAAAQGVTLSDSLKKRAKQIIE